MTWIVSILRDGLAALSWFGVIPVALLLLLTLAGAFTSVTLRLEEFFESVSGRSLRDIPSQVVAATRR